MKKVIVVILLIAALFLITSCGGKDISPENKESPESCSPDSSDDDPDAIAQWNSIKQNAITQVQTTNEWKAAELVAGEANTIGWEDSISISPDGNTLSLMYLRGDLFHIDDIFYYHRPIEQGGLGADPATFAQYHRGPDRGVTPVYTSDIFSFTKTQDYFCTTKRFQYSRDGRNEWGSMESSEGDVYYVSHQPAITINKDIYKNNNPLNIPGKDVYDEDDPHFIITSYGRELFFWSDNRSPDGKRHIWVTRETDGEWSEPELLAPPITVADETQPFLTADEKLYFTSSRGGTISIWVSQREGQNTWGEPEKVVWPTPQSNVFGVGEPTLTADGAWLYFVVVFHNGNNQFDADAGRVRRR